MSARKLGRLAGFVFVLAAVFGGVGAAQRGRASTRPAAADSAAVRRRGSDVDSTSIWS